MNRRNTPGVISQRSPKDPRLTAVADYRADLSKKPRNKLDEVQKKLSDKLEGILGVIDDLDHKLFSFQPRSSNNPSVDLDRLYQVYVTKVLKSIPNRERYANYVDGAERLSRAAREFKVKFQEIEDEFASEYMTSSSKKDSPDKDRELDGIRDKIEDRKEFLRSDWIASFRSQLKGIAGEIISSNSLSGETAFRVSQSRLRATRDQLVREAPKLYRKHLARLGEIQVLVAITRKPEETEALRSMEKDTRELVDLLAQAAYFQIGMSDDNILRIGALNRRLETPQREYDISQDSEERIFQLDEWRQGREEVRTKFKEGTINLLNKLGVSKNLSVGGVARGIGFVAKGVANVARAARNLPSRLKELNSFRRSIGSEAKSFGRQGVAAAKVFSGAASKTFRWALRRSRPTADRAEMPAFAKDLDLQAAMRGESAEPMVPGMSSTAAGSSSPVPASGSSPIDGSMDEGSLDPTSAPTSQPPSLRDVANAPSTGPAGNAAPPISTELPSDARADTDTPGESSKGGLASVSKKIVRLSRQMAAGFEVVLKSISSLSVSGAQPTDKSASGALQRSPPAGKSASFRKMYSLSRVLSRKSRPSGGTTLASDFDVQRRETEEDLFKQQVELLRKIADTLVSRGKDPAAKGSLLSVLVEKLGSLKEVLGSVASAVGGLAGVWALLKGGAGRLITTVGGGLLSMVSAALPALLSPIGLAVAAAATAAAIYAVNSSLSDKVATIDKEGLQARDDANWNRASFLEKLQSAPARGIEKAGRMLGMGNTATMAQASRVESETNYLAKEGKYSTQSEARRAEPSADKIRRATPAAKDALSFSEPGGPYSVATPMSSPDIYSPKPIRDMSPTRQTESSGTPTGSPSASSSYTVGSSMEGLNPDFRSRFVAAVQEYKQRGGKQPVNVNRAFASREEQAELYKKYGPGRAAPPGRSLHEFGYAIDIDRGAANDMDKMGLLSKHGISRPVPGEPWHLQAAGMTSALARQGIYSSDAATAQGAPSTPEGSSGGSQETAPTVSDVASSSAGGSTTSASASIAEEAKPETSVRTSKGSTAEQAAYDPQSMQNNQASDGGISYTHKGKGAVATRASANSVNTVPTFSYLDPGMMIMNIGVLT